MNNQQDTTKKEIPLDFTYDDDLTDYMTKYLPAINEFDEVKHDFLTNKNSKFLFHLFNKYQEDRGKPKFPIRHSTLTDDNYALESLQNRNCPYFIRRIIEFSQGFINLSDLTESDTKEINILNNTRANFEIVKNLYNELFTSVGINLHEHFKNLRIIERQRIDTDLTNNNFLTWDAQEDFIQQRILATYRDFFYNTGRFPGLNRIIPLPRAEIPSFIESQDVLSPRDLYESFVGRDMQGLPSVQFLAAFNRFLGGDKEISRNALSEFFHNLSWQVLTNDNDSVQVKFEAATELVKNINYLLRQKIYENKKKTMEIGKKIVEQLTSQEKETAKTEIEKVEEKVVDDIISNDETNHIPEYIPPTVKTEEEIDENRLEWNRNFLATELAKKERDFEIIDDIEAKEQYDLIKDVIDPSDGLLTNEEIDPTDYNRTIKIEPLAPQLDPNILNIMREVVNHMSDQVNSQADEMPALEDVPEIKYEPEEDIKPNWQDLLTNSEPEEIIEDFKDLKDEIKEEMAEVINENVDPLETAMPEIFEKANSMILNLLATTFLNSGVTKTG